MWRIALAVLRPARALFALIALPWLASPAQATVLCGDITSNTTLTLAGSPYTVTCIITVGNGAQLTIEPGVTLEFEAGAGLNVGQPFTSNTGSLMAVGTAGSPILFTSTSGAPGGWLGIVFSGASLASQMSYCVIENGGQGGSLGWFNVKCISTSQPAMDHCTIRRSAVQGLELVGASLAVTATEFSENQGTDLLCTGSSSPTLVGCSFASGSHLAVDVDGSTSVPVLSGCTFSGSGPYAIRVPPMSIGTGSISLSGYTVGVRLVNGPVTANRAWGVLGSELVYEVEEGVITVGNGAQLTIEPGVTLKFEAGAGLQVAQPFTSNAGSLMAVGTAESPIVFTSTSGAPGGWLGIVFSGASLASQMSYCVIENGGQGGGLGWFNVKCLSTSQPAMDHCTIRRSLALGLDLATASLTVTATEFSENQGTDLLCQGGSSPTLTGCSFATGSHLGVDVDGATSVPAFSGCTFSGSGPHAIRVPPMSIGTGSISLSGYTVGVRLVNGPVTANRTWGVLGAGLVYEIEDPVGIQNGSTLTIEPGVTLKFQATAGLQVGQGSTGSLMAVGTAEAPIVFTSTSGVPGGWLGISFTFFSAPSQMSHCVVENGGGNNFGEHFNIKALTSQPGLTSCVIRNSGGWGLLKQAGGSVTASQCAFTCNAMGAVSCDGDGSVVATNCWWGDPSGPSDPSTGAPDYNPGGQGQSVTDYVTYRPWLTGSPGFIESAIAKRWSGLGDGTTWNDPDNWVGGVRPGTIDRVLFDNSQLPTSYEVQLPPGSSTVFAGRVTIAPDPGQTIILVLPSANTAAAGLRVDDLNSEGDDIVLQTGGVLRNASGASSGNGIAGNPLCSARIRIENGGRYVHATALAPSGILAMMSQAAGTERGEFEYDVPGTGTVAIDADGRTYGSLVLARSAGAATYTSSGSNALTVRGDFRAETGVTYASAMTAPMHVGGHWTNDGAPLTLAAQSIVFDGLLGPQTISGSATTTWNGGASVAAPAAVTIASGVTVEIGAPVANGGSLSLAGTLQVNEGGSASGNEFGYAPTGTLVCNRSGGPLVIDGGAALWPTGGGPSNVVAQGAGITVDVARNATNVSLFAPILNAGNLTVNGTALMNAGGSFASAPVYGADATLQYATGDWAPGPEWSLGSSVGSGVPRHVNLAIGAGNELSMPASDRTVPGTLTVESGTLQLDPTSGNLRVGDDVSVLPSGGIVTNGRTLILDGGLGGDANIVLDPAGGVLTLDHLQLQNAVVSIVPHGWEMVIAPSSGESVRMTGAAELHLNGTTLRLAGGPSTIAVADGARTIFGPGTLDLASAVTVVDAGNGGTLVTDNCDNVLRSLTEPGAGLTTVKAGTLTLEGGSAVAHAPLYANGVTLIYHDGSFVTGPEWTSGAVEGLGVPQNVTIDAGAADTVRTQNSPLTVPGNLVILSGTLVGPDTTSIVVEGDVDVGPGGKISGKGRGHGSSQGPGGPGGISGGGAGGAAHGGHGGNGSTGQGSTSTYDSPDAPLEPGSGGGSSGSATGGAGGGVVRLVVVGTLTLDGSIDADGEDGAAGGGDAGGGGAGGSVSITASEIQGSGAVRARGGVGGTAAAAFGGGGGGGRIALYHLDPVSGVESGYVIASLSITVETVGGAGGGGTATAGDEGTTQERQITGVTDPPNAIPSLAYLDAPFPNPFHGTATLVFGLPSPGHVRIDIFDLRGGRVRTLLDAEQPAGTGRVQWDGHDESGHRAESGVYFARMEADRHTFRTSFRLVR